MLRSLKSLRWVSVFLLAACGSSDLPAGEAPPAIDTVEQGVLFPPPTPSSGNVLDSTTFLGSVALPGAVQTSFTTPLQYYSFAINVAAGSSAKLEVTHLGSSMSLDTGLFVYGPRDASGSYGTTVRAQDDDAGYGQLSKVASVTFAQGGEYLVVVSSGEGAGKRFRLQLDCLSGNCEPVDPSVYATCDQSRVGPRVEDCMAHWDAEGLPVNEAFALCFGADDAHALYEGACAPSASSKPVWCAGGEATWTQRMWPVCVSDYTVAYGLYSVSLGSRPVSTGLQSKLSAANAACGTSSACYGELRGYSFPWSHSTPASLDKVAEAVSLTEQSNALFGARLANTTYAQFAQSRLLSRLSSLHPALGQEYSNGSEAVQVTGWHYSREMWPDACMIWELYVIYFPESRGVLVFEQDYARDC
ncbi:hypothetical protein HUA74_03305 [Myxococcus sp. CA051A]|uniref:hypothetical protein n=1 Tax=Myxococcus sp. CA051A TaxID=2741739 RepID=UPI00157ACF05|nr:hypothetical protein [Myxococcus sp. CA051A]NTX59680.1 hypothetical protein [Myxococcus sp. CA051A]